MNFIVQHEFVRFLFLYRFLLISCVLLIEKCSKERKSKNKILYEEIFFTSFCIFVEYVKKTFSAHINDDNCNGRFTIFMPCST